jgi:hypothetical protein
VIPPEHLLHGNRPAATPDGPAGWVPPRNMPTHAELVYWKEAIMVGLLILALPWLIHRLLTDPGKLVANVRVP